MDKKMILNNHRYSVRSPVVYAFKYEKPSVPEHSYLNIQFIDTLKMALRELNVNTPYGIFANSEGDLMVEHGWYVTAISNGTYFVIDPQSKTMSIIHEQEFEERFVKHSS